MPISRYFVDCPAAIAFAVRMLRAHADPRWALRQVCYHCNLGYHCNRLSPLYYAVTLVALCTTMGAPSVLVLTMRAGAPLVTAPEVLEMSSVQTARGLQAQRPVATKHGGWGSAAPQSSVSRHTSSLRPSRVKMMPM